MEKDTDKKVSKKALKVKEEYIQEDFSKRKLEIFSPDDFNPKKYNKPIKETKKIEKNDDKNNNVWIATFILFLLLFAIVIGVVYWYEEVYKKDVGIVNEVVNKKLGYSFVTYKSDKQLKLINDRYLIEYNDNTLYRVFDKDGNKLFDDEIVFDYLYVDLKENLYVVTDDSTDLGNILSLYILENEKFVLVKDYSQLGYDFRIITYEKDNLSYLYGISEVAYRAYESENVNNLTLLKNDNVIELDKGIYFGNLNVDTFTTYSERYIVVNNQSKVGLYDLEENKLIIDFNYESIDLVDGKNNLLVVKRNGKYALLNLDLKKLIDYKYDYFKYSDEFILVGKDNKLNVLNDKYKEVIEGSIPCEYNLDNIIIDSMKVGEKVVIEINDINEEESYNTYFIDITNQNVSNIKEEFINETEFSYTVSSDNKIYSIYNEELVKIGSIDLNGFDFDKQVLLKKIGDTYIVNDRIYFDGISFEQIDNFKDFSIVSDNYSLKINSNKEVSVVIDGKVVGTYDYIFPNEMYNETNDNLFYYLSDSSYVTIKKVNE